MKAVTEVGFLFDLDGVLIDSERRYTRIWQAIDDEFPSGIDDFPRVIKGMTLHNILATYYGTQQLREQVKSRCLEAEAHLDFAWMPGAVELLSRLKSMGVPVAMVTSSDSAKMNMLRTKLPEIFDWFEVVVDGDMVTHGKPHPEPYLTGASMLGIPPRRCAVCEDALNGIEAARRAGTYVIGMTDTLGPAAIGSLSDEAHASLFEVNPEEVVKKLLNRKENA